MYNGLQSVIEKTHREKYFPGIGTKSVYSGAMEVHRHCYTCDYCGKQSAFHTKADFPFYCHSADCQGVKLVSIDEEGS